MSKEREKHIYFFLVFVSFTSKNHVHIIFPSPKQNLKFTEIGENHINTYDCALITIVFDTPIYVQSEWSTYEKTEFYPYGPPTSFSTKTYSSTSPMKLFRILNNTNLLSIRDITTDLNAYDPKHPTWRRRAFSMFSKAYESSHHVIEILVPFHMTSPVIFDVSSPVSLFDRSGTPFQISNVPMEVVTLSLPSSVYSATFFDVVTSTPSLENTCISSSDSEDRSFLNQVELETHAKHAVSPFGMMVGGMLGVIMAPMISQLSSIIGSENSVTLGSKITEETGANGPIKIVEYVTAAVTYNLNAVLTDSITKRVSASLSELVVNRLAPVVSVVSIDRILNSVRHKIGETISSSLIQSLNDILSREISRSLLYELTETLTRSVTHSVVPAISMATGFDASKDMACKACFEENAMNMEACRKCPFSSYSSYYFGYYST